ncbi:hypothetical protein NCS52_00973500 [Fusarium sp. LHS14.1]|nr:hypothetical protein NCS52_00973500 [Fusarium sp. LHS14.1]
MRLWKVRQRLGFLSPWTSDYIEVSKAVSLAIESVMGILQDNAGYSSVTDSFRWSLKGKWSDPEVFPFTLSLGNDKLHPWGSPGEIEAALSTWSYFLDRLPEERKVVRSLEHSHEFLRRDITRWAGQKETGLLLFDLVQEGGPPVSHRPLSASTRLLGTLLAQRVFLWFMLDLADFLPSRLSKAPTVTFLDDNNPTLETTRLEHPNLTAMVHRIQQSGLASTEEAWDLVIVPLSFHRKLPNPITIVEKMRDQSKNLEQAGQWEQVFKIHEQVAEVLKEVDDKAKHEREAYYRAAAIVLDTYRRVSSILDVQIQQLRRTNNLTQLLQVERKMKEIVCKKMEASVVRALLDFYGLQRPQSPRFEIGRLGMKFKRLTEEFEAVNADDSFKDITEARLLLHMFETPLGISDDLFLWRPEDFDWGQASCLFPDPLGLTLAHHAMIRGVNKLASALDLVGPDNVLVTPASDIAGWTSLHYTSMSHEVQRTITALWRYGGSVHARSRDGTTPLHCLARTSTRDEVTHLLDLGATARVQDNSGYTPLHWTAWCGNLDAIEVLLSRGADPGSRDNYGRTALHIATISWKEKAVAMLSHTTDMGAQDVDGNTALHYAAMLGNCALASRNCAEETSQEDSPRLSDAVEDNALVTALFSGQNQVKREEGNDGEHSYSVSGTETSINTGTEKNQTKPLPFEPRLLGSVNVDGNAPIHVAVEHGHLKVVERLLGPGEQWHKTAYGITPLRLAVMFGRPKVVESLVEAHNDGSQPDDLEEEENLFKMIKDFRRLKEVLGHSGRDFGKLRTVVLSRVEARA